MSFSKALKQQREKQGLSQEEAAKCVHLSLDAYKDREIGLVTLSIMEEVGLLTTLGMNADEALKAACEPQISRFGSPEMQEIMRRRSEKPFVTETAEGYVFDCRDGGDYFVLKDRIRSASNVLGMIDHLSEKVWFTKDHLRSFTYLATENLKVKIHPV